MRKIAIAAAVSLSLSGMGGVSHALGLGEIEMYSALNQTLDAEIEILSATDDELRNLQVGLAPASAFARAGLEQSSLISSIDFAVDRRPDGKAVVKVTNDVPVLEPFLNFLIEVDAPGSVTLVREYTVLLNPSSLAGEPRASAPTAPAAASDQNAVFAGNTPDTSASGATGSGGVPVSLAGLTGITDDVGEESAAEVAFTVSSNAVTEPDSDVSRKVDTGFVPSATTLATQAESDNGNAIFGNEFEPDQSDDLIQTGELLNFASDDSDAQGNAGDLIDLSGILDDSASGTSSPRVASVERSSNRVGTGGVAIQIDDLGSSAAPSTPDFSDFEVSGNTYRIRSQDTLWRVANGQKGRGVTTHQMMVALHETNPNAFINGDMNRLRNGEVLKIPIASAQQSMTPTDATAIVESWTRGYRPSNSSNSNTVASVAPPPVVYEQDQSVVYEQDQAVVYEQDSFSSFGSDTTTYTNDLSQNLDDVNQRYDEVRTEIATGTQERDQLQGRVDNLTDNMAEMKGLITVRENELSQLQDEVAAAESNAAAIDAQISQLSDASANVTAVQQGLTGDLAEAQRAVERQADVDKNLATAQAETQSVRLAIEEDSLRAQLAALDLEKRDLEASSQSERAALVREAEADKNRLLARTKAEREAIMAELEADKARISSEAELEIIRLRAEAEIDNQRVLQQAQADRARVAAESQQMQAELQRMEAEKSSLMAEAGNGVAQMDDKASTSIASATDASSVSGKLAQMKEDAAGKLTDAKDAMMGDKSDAMMADKSDSDADGKGILGGMAETSKNMAESGKNMAAGGAAAVGGLLGAAPLQEALGNRKTLLAAGAGISLVGLLAAWGFRRRKKVAPKEVRGVHPRPDTRPVPSSSQTRARHEQEEKMYGDTKEARGQSQKRSGKSGTAAAAAAAAAITGTAVARNRNDKEAHAPAGPAVEPMQRSASVTAPQPDASVTPAPAPTTLPSNPVPEAPSVELKKPEVSGLPGAAGLKDAGVEAVDPELEETALDDTITEAEVYLRYGLHGQTEDLLKTAIERSPNNEEYHFKLLENYHDQKNPGSFTDAATTFKEKFPKSDHLSRIAEMGAEIGEGGNDSSSGVGAGGIPGAGEGGNDSSSGVGAGGILGAAGAAAAGAAAVATGAVGNAKDAAADGLGALKGTATDTGSGDSNFNFSAGGDDNLDHDFLDQTIDPGSEFSVDELQATGNLGAFVDDEADFGDQGGLSLDDVDLASLDDDGTMNLEKIAGDKMSGSDLGSLDLTNPDMDNSLGDLSFGDADLSSLDDMKGKVSGKLDNDMSLDTPITAGGTDEMETMLDLAKAYIDMGDDGNASKALKDIAARGNPLQQTEAAELLKKLK